MQRRIANSRCIDRLEKHAPRLAQLLRRDKACSADEEEELIREITEFAFAAEKAEVMFIGTGRWLINDVATDVPLWCFATVAWRRLPPLQLMLR